MSDNFIPLNQSTPVQNRWQQQDKSQQQRFNNRQHGHGDKWRGGGHNNWNNSRNSSYGSNSSNNSYQERYNIDAYLHPSMLQDPWASLRQYNASRHNSST